MLQRFAVTALLSAALLPAQNNWFDPALLDRPDVAKAIQSIDDRSEEIIDEWIRITKIPAPSKQEQARAEYMRAETEKLGLAEIRVDETSNVSGVRKGTGGGPTVVFAAHTDTAAAKKVAEEEGVGFRMEESAVGLDYSKARSTSERLNHPLVQTAAATANFFRKEGSATIVPADWGSNDSNIAVAMGIPAVALGAALWNQPHQLEEYAEASSIVPGIKSLIALAVSLTTH